MSILTPALADDTNKYINDIYTQFLEKVTDAAKLLLETRDREMRHPKLFDQPTRTNIPKTNGILSHRVPGGINEFRYKLYIHIRKNTTLKKFVLGEFIVTPLTSTDSLIDDIKGEINNFISERKYSYYDIVTYCFFGI